jgi:hypothetical protein
MSRRRGQFIHFFLLIASAPNVIAHDSKQVTMCDFFKSGVLAGIILLVVPAFAGAGLWVIMAMPLGCDV